MIANIIQYVEFNSIITMYMVERLRGFVIVLHHYFKFLHLGHSYPTKILVFTNIRNANI